ncbi:MAG TPA: T9SS type A sorting domain-containing protein, partial [Bacteroidia bacterium]|nr:T9SS type A sorting domain-containing protein [Bacteroidia bacterium]
TTVNNDDGSFDVIFDYNSNLPYSYKIVDMVGNIVSEKAGINAVNGSNILNVKSHLASGVYTIMIHNQQETVTRKIFR